MNDSESEVLFVGADFYPIIDQILEDLPKIKKVVAIDGDHENYQDYISWRNSQNSANSEIKSSPNDDILQLYTSGTTGNPKGVVYHHRGAYLMSTGSATAWNMPNGLNFLTIVPMFHCNGWGYPWTCLLYTSPSPRD